ncbi:MAG: DEAD/DEAH box helicase family protein [Gemmataceae bacterium]|nr:DEAD/DEAH box helicase family protein [Gemmataceae bacterium]
MPALRECNFQISYGPNDDPLRTFFIPALSASVRYDRAAGYFSSSMLSVAAAGVVRLIANGGKMRLLCGADLSEDDVAAIAEGHAQLEELVARRMKIRLALPEDDYIRNRVKALAWLVGTGQLEIKVVLPTDSHGRPLPAGRSECYYHPKEGVFSDAAGDQVGFSGSINESVKALEYNYESFMRFESWSATAPYLKQITTRFTRLWEGKEKDWIALPIPEAVRQELLKLRPAYPPTHDALEPPEPPIDKPIAPDNVRLDEAEIERILFQFLRDAPHLLNAGQLGLATCTVEPWPHQERVARAVVEQYPQSFMLCDEVGLGKTIEAGMIIHQLLLSGRVRRALLLVPKSVLVQWQEELYEKFALNVPRYDGATCYDVFKRELKVPAGTNPWDAYPVVLASSHLAKRRERQQQLMEARGWDLLVVDEAHHARRKDFLNRDQVRANRLLELLAGSHGQGLRDKAKSMLLLTATPMQIDPVEVWDLLKMMGMGGRWGAGEGNFLRYFDELRQPVEDADWKFVLGMLADFFAAGGKWDPSFCKVAEQRLGPVVWEQLRNLPNSGNPEAVIRRLPANAQAFLKEMAKRHTPIRRYIFRNTRNLLRVYCEKGLLKENIPHRDPKPVWIDMQHEESELYDRIEEYIRHHYQKYEAERKGLGFIMTVYRRRLTSSFYAIEQSLKRRLGFLRGTLGLDQLVTDDDTDQEDLEQDVVEELFPAAPGMGREMADLCKGEIDYLEDFLFKLHSLSSDSKFEQLATDLGQLLKQRDSVLIFTQYTDTMDYLRDRLRAVYGSQVACYSGRGGERWQDGKWIGTSKENVKTAFRERRDIKVLLCTESASEGLNLQTCGILINYDMPWNPMRVEQRIGRIDRIGQTFQRVWVRNYFYEGTVEADIYHRLDSRIGSFEHVVGELQPILARVARVIELAAMASDERRAKLIAREVEAINQSLHSAEVSALNLDTYIDDQVEAAQEMPLPVTLSELERTLVKSAALRDRFQPHAAVTGAHLLDWRGRQVGVTFDPAVFDEHPDTLQLVTFGSALLHQLLEIVEPPADRPERGVVQRCRIGDPVERINYYAAGRPDLAIPTLSSLRQCLEAIPPQLLTADAITQATTTFKNAVGTSVAEEDATLEALNRSRRASLVEEVRQLLLQAAYIELALAVGAGLYDERLPVDFSPQAIVRLKRHKYPFAGALKAVSIDGLNPSAEDAGYQRLLESKRDVVQRRFESIRGKLGNALAALVGANADKPTGDHQTDFKSTGPHISFYNPTK